MTKNILPSDESNTPSIDRVIQEKKHRVNKPLILAGNGGHLAHGELNGILEEITGKENTFLLNLSNWTFKAVLHPLLWKKYQNNPSLFSGKKSYICYPRLTSEGTIDHLCIAILAEQGIEKEQWTFIGTWHKPTHTVHIQRSLSKVKEKNLKTFTFYLCEWEKFEEKLWHGYCYTYYCKRTLDRLILLKTIPFACPLKKTQNYHYKKSHSNLTFINKVRQKQK